MPRGEEHPVSLRAVSGAGPKVCFKGLVHRASGDPGRRQVRLIPHRCTRAEKLLVKHEGVGEEAERWVREATAWREQLSWTSA